MAGTSKKERKTNFIVYVPAAVAVELRAVAARAGMTANAWVGALLVERLAAERAGADDPCDAELPYPFSAEGTLRQQGWSA